MRKPEHPNVGRAGFLPSFSQNQKSLSSSDLQSLSDGVRGATLLPNKSDPNLQIRQTSSGISIASNYKEPFNPDAFEVTWIGDDTFNIRGGNCQFMQYATNLTHDPDEGIVGNPTYSWDDRGMSNMQVDRPLVWSESRPKAPTTANTAGPTLEPKLDTDYIVCPRSDSTSPKAKSNQWSVIIGMPVPNNLSRPALYIVPRTFAQTNLACGKTPAFGVRALLDDFQSDTYEGDVEIGQGATLVGDLESGYTLENNVGPMPYHSHAYLKVYAMIAKWQALCFGGMVIAHMNYDTAKKKWSVIQYHKGNVTLMTHADLKSVGISDESGDSPPNWGMSVYDIQDHYWGTSTKVTYNSANFVSGTSNLRHQTIEYNAGALVFY